MLLVVILDFSMLCSVVGMCVRNFGICEMFRLRVRDMVMISRVWWFSWMLVRMLMFEVVIVLNIIIVVLFSIGFGIVWMILVMFGNRLSRISMVVIYRLM